MEKGAASDPRIQRSGLDFVVDIHGMKAYPAKRYLQSILPGLSRDKDASALVVVHGYRSGTALRDMVRGELKSPFIQSRRPGMSDGHTVLILNKK